MESLLRAKVVNAHVAGEAAAGRVAQAEHAAASGVERDAFVGPLDAPLALSRVGSRVGGQEEGEGSGAVILQDAEGADGGANTAQGDTLPLNSMLGEPTPADSSDEESIFDESDSELPERSDKSPLDDLPDLPDDSDEKTIDELLDDLPEDEARRQDAATESLQVTDETAPSEEDFDSLFDG